jgi:TRAP-type mannitol/chloroaromatic compound transport system permease small subunit
MTDFLHLCFFLLPWAIGVFYLGFWMIDAYCAAIRDLAQDRRP